MTTLLALVALLGFLAGSAAGATNARPSLVSCNLPDVARSARCGVLDVLENPNRPHGRHLSIHFAVIPASSGRPPSDAIAVLMGGPGESAIDAAGMYVGWLGPLLADRDLLLVDQRGTGRSAPLKCDLYSAASPADSLRDFFPLAAVMACRRRLEKAADLSMYIYSYFARDLEQVRSALGYGRLNLFAGSYGTRAAQVYMRAYPQSVRTAYLGSVVPVDIEGPLDFARTEQGALERMMRNCESDPPCHHAFPQLRNELGDVVGRLAAGKVHVSLPGRREAVVLDRGPVVEWFRSKLYRPRDAANLPWIIHRAFRGDWTPVVAGILSGARHIGDDISLGLFFSITCSEEMPFVDEQQAASETEGTLLGDYRLRQQQAACREWPRSRLPDNYRTQVQSAVPTLFVRGDEDGGTPLWFTDRVARGFANRAIVTAHGQGHTEWSRCIAAIYAKLVRNGSVKGLHTDTCPPIRLPPFKTDT